jgi:purine-binding chemotaxis protein CheW
VTSDATTKAYLLCRIGARVCAIPLAHVLETMRPLPIEPLAGMPRCVLGVAIIRGVPIPVLDTGLLVGVVDFEATRFVTVKIGTRSAALSMGAVLGVQSLAEGSLAGIPPLLREANADSIAAIGALDAELLLLLETTRLLPDSTFRAIEAAGAPS